MACMETVEPRGLDLLEAMLLAVVVLDFVEYGQHSAWETVSSRVRWPTSAAERPDARRDGFSRVVGEAALA